MGKHNRCCVGPCDNDKRYKEKFVIHSNVKTGKIRFHIFPADKKKRALWTAQVLLGRKDWSPGKFAYVCSNHFVDGEPTKENPVPTLFMKGPPDAKTPTKRLRKPPAKRRIMCVENENSDEQEPSSSTTFTMSETQCQSSEQMNELDVAVQTTPCYFAMQFEHLTREYDVRFYTGFESPEIFSAVFDFVKVKASIMTYWDGTKRTILPQESSKLVNLMASSEYNFIPLKPGPSRKLLLQQEFLLTMMRWFANR